MSFTFSLAPTVLQNKAMAAIVLRFVFVTFEILVELSGSVLAIAFLDARVVSAFGIFNAKL